MESYNPYIYIADKLLQNNHVLTKLLFYLKLANFIHFTSNTLQNK